ncbi:hypothetical protein L2E82_21144 [Cichorium intybus]|uniref:Uncharacterized protein n=1 Tax=Cichorium intybus TaxID=13427 RepID=A0ACB9DVR0_CICIN|nr:hypothetical protein L2E82_21144 [Cichorium intybus]
MHLLPVFPLFILHVLDSQYSSVGSSRIYMRGCFLNAYSSKDVVILVNETRIMFLICDFVNRSSLYFES